MNQRPWHRAAAVILGGGLLGILLPAAAGAQSEIPSLEPLPADTAPGPQPAAPGFSFPQLPFPAFPSSSQTSISETPGVTIPEAEAPATQATNLGTPALAMLGVAGQGVRIPIPQL